MVLAQLLQRLEGKFRELTDLEQRVLAADKAEVVPLRRQFIDLLFGPRFFGSEEFFRMYSGETNGSHRDESQLVLGVAGEHQTWRRYFETAQYQAITFGKGGNIINFLLLRMKDSSEVESYMYTGVGEYGRPPQEYITDAGYVRRGKEVLHEFELESGIAAQYVYRGVIVGGSNPKYYSLSIRRLAPDDIARTDHSSTHPFYTKDVFPLFHEELISTTRILLGDYEYRCERKSEEFSGRKAEMERLGLQLELMRALAGNRQ